MKGARPLDAAEVKAIMNRLETLRYRYRGQRERNLAIFTLGCFSGERIGSILQLRLKDVMPNGKLDDYVHYAKRTRKGKTETRIVRMHPKVKRALRNWLKVRNSAVCLDDQATEILKAHPDWNNKRIGRAVKSRPDHLSASHFCPKFKAMRAALKAGKDIEESHPAEDKNNGDSLLFFSRKFHNGAFCRHEYHRVLKRATRDLKLPGRVSCHSMRKFFATQVYKLSGNNLLVTQRALGHASITNTVLYLDCTQEDVTDAIMRMS